MADRDLEGIRLKEFDELKQKLANLEFYTRNYVANMDEEFKASVADLKSKDADLEVKLEKQIAAFSTGCDDIMAQIAAISTRCDNLSTRQVQLETSVSERFDEIISKVQKLEKRTKFYFGLLVTVFVLFACASAIFYYLLWAQLSFIKS